MKRLPRLHQLHRWVGITVAVLVLLLVVSGWLLNHTERLQLDERYVNNSWLLDWYGVKPAKPPVSHAAGDHWITQINGQLYFDETLVTEGIEQLVGAVWLDRLLIIAADDDLYLLLDDGQLVEKLSGAEGVPSGMQRVGLDGNGRLIIEGAHDIYTGDLDKLEWHSVVPENVNWSRASKPPAGHIEAVMQLYRGRGLSFERVVLDMHSGRIGGTLGVIVIDLAGVLFCILAVTGLMMWLRR